MPLDEREYEWDEAKRAENLRQYKLDFASMSRFDWTTAMFISSHRDNEIRYIAYGISILKSAPSFIRLGDPARVSSACAQPVAGRELYMLKPNCIPQEAWDELVAGDLTFDQIEERFCEEVAINAGIARDPDAFIPGR